MKRKEYEIDCDEEYPVYYIYDGKIEEDNHIIELMPKLREQFRKIARLNTAMQWYLDDKAQKTDMWQK